VTVDMRELPAIVRQAAVDLEGAPALDVLRWADETFGSAWCVASSMADAVLPHLASQVRPGVDVIWRVLARVADGSNVHPAPWRSLQKS